MSLTTLDGLVMGTRPGSIDVGVVLYLIQQLRIDVDSIGDALHRQSGLLGLSGISADMRVLANPIKINGERLSQTPCSAYGADTSSVAHTLSIVLGVMLVLTSLTLVLRNWILSLGRRGPDATLGSWDERTPS